MTNPQIRIGHCSPDAPNVDICVDGDPVFKDVALQDISEYTSLSSGRHEIRIAPAGADDTVIETTLRCSDDTLYTALATGLLEDIDVSVFEDDPGEIPSGKAHVRFIHASPDAPRVTVQVRDGPKVVRRLKFRKASRHEQVDAAATTPNSCHSGAKSPR
jgi:hypothetical protein